MKQIKTQVENSVDENDTIKICGTLKKRRLKRR